MLSQGVLFAIPCKRGKEGGCRGKETDKKRLTLIDREKSAQRVERERGGGGSGDRNKLHYVYLGLTSELFFHQCQCVFEKTS